MNKGNLLVCTTKSVAVPPKLPPGGGRRSSISELPPPPASGAHHQWTYGLHLHAAESKDWRVNQMKNRKAPGYTAMEASILCFMLQTTLRSDLFTLSSCSSSRFPNARYP